MTNIIIEKGGMSVTARGHAAAGKPDVVCAACSMLMYALRAFAEESGGAGFEEDGYMRVEFPIEENDYLFGGFDALCEGLRLLADEYPDNVRVEG